LRGKFNILFSSPRGSVCPRHGTFVGILQAFSLSLLEPCRFRKDTLPLVTPP
jgi:hypothetical protein